MFFQKLGSRMDAPPKCPFSVVSECWSGGFEGAKNEFEGAKNEFEGHAQMTPLYYIKTGV